MERNVFPRWCDVPVSALTADDAEAIVTTVADRGAVTQARRLHAHLHRFIRWCVLKRKVVANPLDSVVNPAATTKRNMPSIEGVVKRATEPAPDNTARVARDKKLVKAQLDSGVVSSSAVAAETALRSYAKLAAERAHVRAGLRARATRTTTARRNGRRLTAWVCPQLVLLVAGVCHRCPVLLPSSS